MLAKWLYICWLGADGNLLATVILTFMKFGEVTHGPTDESS